jgi:hypothetical protein
VTNDTTGNSYQYDAIGNMTTRSENGVTWTQTYNAENRQAKMSNTKTQIQFPDTLSINSKWEFTYDGDGNKVMQKLTIKTTNTTTNVETGSKETTTYFAGGAYEQTTDGGHHDHPQILLHRASRARVINFRVP